jgi:hypothetical protein
MPAIALKYALHSPREAYIAENGIVYEGAVYPFHSFLMKMEAATFHKRTGKKPAVLIFSFTQFVGLNIRSPFDIEIPVPEGEEEKARKIAERESFLSLPGRSIAQGLGPTPSERRQRAFAGHPEELSVHSVGELWAQALDRKKGKGQILLHFRKSYH